MWSKIWNAIRSVIEKMIGVKSVEQALHIQPVMSNKMEKAIKLKIKNHRLTCESLKKEKGDMTLTS